MLAPVNQNRLFPDGLRTGEPNLLVAAPGIFVYNNAELKYILLHKNLF